MNASGMPRIPALVTAPPSLRLVVSSVQTNRRRRFLGRTAGLLRAQPGGRRQAARAVTVRLVDEAGVPVNVATPLARQLGMTLEAWAEFYGVPDHVRWNLHLRGDGQPSG